MARIRTIKPEFFRHEGLFELEQETGLPVRIAFAGLWTACDREGRFRWTPRALKLDCLPFDDCDFSRVLDALVTRGHIVRYTNDGREYGAIPSWADHQVVNNRELASVLPSPEESVIGSTTSTRHSRVDDATTTPLNPLQVEGKGREGKGREVEGNGAPPKAPPSPTAPPIPKALGIAFLKTQGVNEGHAADWLTVRKSHKAALTQTAWDGLVAEAAKAGISPAEAVRICASKSWRGFDSTWNWRSSAPPGRSETEARNAEILRLMGKTQGEVFDA